MLHMLLLALQTHQELELQRAPHLAKERGHHKDYPKKVHQSHLRPEQATRSRILLVLEQALTQTSLLLLALLAPRTSHHLELEQGLRNQNPQ